jgi:hypothetical protein
VIETTLRTALTNNSAVSALVSSRVLLGFAPLATPLPLIVIQRNDTTYDETYSTEGGLATAQLTVACIAATYTAARALADAVRPVLYATRGSNGIQRVNVTENDGLIVPPEGENVPAAYQTEIECEINYSE